MSRLALSILVFASITAVLAQADPSVSTALADKRFTYPDGIVGIVPNVYDIVIDFRPSTAVPSRY
jgi:hypothetical protein